MSEVVHPPHLGATADFEAEIDRVLKEIELALTGLYPTHADIHRLDEEARTSISTLILSMRK